MASIKVKYRPSGIDGNEGTVYYQIIQERKTRQLVTVYHLRPHEWDEKRSAIIISPKSDRRALLMSIRERIRWDTERLSKIIKKLDNHGLIYTCDDIVEEFNRYCQEYTLFNFMESIIIQLKQNGKIRTAETYVSALNSFKSFRNDDDIMLDCLTSPVMEAYEAWLRKKHVAANTISFYTRILRATYHRAVEEEITENRYPFRHVYTGVDKTVKRALPLSVIKKIKALDLSLTPALEYARDMFILSFMLRGMSFIDMAYLRKSDRVNGHIHYRRRKTGQLLIIEWTPEMQKILDKYPENTSDYLLPIIKRPGLNERNTYRNTGYNINHNLKTVAGMLDISIPLTLYVARHSWASGAKAQGIPISVISEGMGHDSEATTQIYLASLDTTAIDRANSLLLKSID